MLVLQPGEDVCDLDIVVVLRHGGDDVEAQPLPFSDDQGVISFPSRVTRQDDGRELVLMRVEMPAERRVGIGAADELLDRLRRELTTDSDLHDVGVFPVRGDEFLQIALVRALNLAAVNVPRGPQMPILAEALAESAGIAGRVAERDPNDLRVLVGQRALGHFPHLVGDRRSLVEDQDDPLALVVQACEGFGVVLRPWDGIGSP